MGPSGHNSLSKSVVDLVAFSISSCFFFPLIFQPLRASKGQGANPLMANVFMCHLEDKLMRDGVMPALYRRYVDLSQNT